MSETLGVLPVEQAVLPVEYQSGSETAAIEQYLYHDVPHEGFISNEQRYDLVTKIAAVGLPVDNYQSLAYVQNERGREDEFALGSWGIGSENYGRFSIYELNNREIPERQLATIAHEGAHANSPLVQENARLYGGEAERLQAERNVRDITAQSLITGKYLTEYHDYLAAQLYDGKISLDTFAEETHAIASELALTNRSKLAQVEEAQHDKLWNLQMAGLVPGDYQPVRLVSRIAENGEADVYGVDQALITLLRGVNNHTDLIAHVDQLKARFYPEASLAIARLRGEANTTTTQPGQLQPEMERYIYEEALQAADEDEKKKRRAMSYNWLAKSVVKPPQGRQSLN